MGRALSYRSLSLWHETTPTDWTPRAPLAGDGEADVAVVGAGLTGLWTAYHLAVAEPSLRVVVVEAEVGREVCPKSNVSLGVFPSDAEVPLRTIVDAGVPVALGADDPLLFGSRLLAQYETARDVHGFSDAELAELARGSVRMSRAPDLVLARMLRGIDDWLAASP